MSAALGHWSNAPLAYVLAEVRFEPVLEIEKYVPSLQTSLRERYPRFNRIEQVAVLQASSQQEVQSSSLQARLPPRWEFGSDSNHVGVILLQHSLVFHATAYETYVAFGQEWRKVMTQVGECIPNLFTKRIGLRYLDFILPNAGETPENYAVDRLRCDPEPGLPYQSHHGLTLAQYDLEEGSLVARYSRGTGQPKLPPDLAMLSLRPSAIMQRAVDAEQPTAVLDIDRFMELSAVYNVEALSKQFVRLNADIRMAFKALTTDHARAVWSVEPPK